MGINSQLGPKDYATSQDGPDTPTSPSWTPERLEVWRKVQATKATKKKKERLEREEKLTREFLANELPQQREAWANIRGQNNEQRQEGGAMQPPPVPVHL